MEAEQLEQTGYSGGRVLKRHAMKQSILDRGGTQCCSMDSMRKLICFLSIELCKAILVVTPHPHKMMNLEASIICLL